MPNESRIKTLTRRLNASVALKKKLEGDLALLPTVDEEEFTRLTNASLRAQSRTTEREHGQAAAFALELGRAVEKCVHRVNELTRELNEAHVLLHEALHVMPQAYEELKQRAAALKEGFDRTALERLAELIDISHQRQALIKQISDADDVAYRAMQAVAALKQKKEQEREADN